MQIRLWTKRDVFPWGLALVPLFLILLALILSNPSISSASIQEHRDWGDAWDELYPTLSTQNGARHVLGSEVYLGSCVDAEGDGQPTYSASGDDVNVGSPVYGACVRETDEDGVVFTTPLNPGSPAYVAVTANSACVLSAWIDFNADGDWDDADEELFPGGQPLVAGANPLSFTVPEGLGPRSTATARFRCTTDGPVSYTGGAPDGEVEDYRVKIGGELDLGDAPDPPYRTLHGGEVGGAFHYLGSEVYLGSCVDAEADGQPTAAADGDDAGIGSPVYGACESGDDEDGVVFMSDLLAGTTGSISVTANYTCTLSGWIDFNRDGDWWDRGEFIFPNGMPLQPGPNLLNFSIPRIISMGPTYARFRCATEFVYSPDGYAFDGEVEDYRVRLGPPLDFGDAPDPDYPTLDASGGAFHALQLESEVYLGTCVDAELDGQPTLAANGDDVNAGSPVFGACEGNDDEDGVTFTTDLLAGDTAEIEVAAHGDCTLSGWLDFNADGDWWDADEDLFPGGRSIVSGTNTLSFTVPAKIARGPSYARFRCTTGVVDGPVGFAPNGEVEDYRVRLGPPLDFGDAPDPPHPTLSAHAGASHVLGSDIYLGGCVDAEFDGQPSFPADRDDASAGSPVFGACEGDDDEDGVTFVTDLLAGDTAEIEVLANAECTLSAWLDFDGDGDWSDAADELFPGGQPLMAGPNILTFTVPAGAVEGFTHARFRCTSDGAVGFAGPAPNGEVEDYRVSIGHNLDLGDALDPTYPTLLANAGASHVLGSDVYLGGCVDAEADGQPTAAATGDDLNIGSPVFGSCARVTDEDGVAFVTPPYVGGTAAIVVMANADCTLSAWMDFNADGDWADAGESLFPGGQPLAAGPNPLSFAVPASAVEGETYARFRCTTDGPVSFTGEAPDGEVEDYRVVVGPPVDWGDAPDPDYPTLAASAGAGHILGSDVYLGACVDAEADGQPTLSASGDDASAGAPIFGACAGGDDEDGVTFTSNLLAGQEANVEVVANADCTLTAWIDFNADGVWSAGESLFPGGRALAAGSNTLSFPVPPGAVEGETYARFRCTSGVAAPLTGLAPNGEVEDYRVRIGVSLDFGDASGSHYPTLVERGGASHALGSGVYLGACVDAEPDGQPTPGADGDDAGGGNPLFGACGEGGDEDGVTFTSNLVAGQAAGFEVVANAECVLSAWVDFNADGDWEDDGESLFPGGQQIAAGPNTFTFTVPAGAAQGPSHARFRCTTDGEVSFAGPASDGEVEDYRVALLVPVDYLPLVLRDY